MHIFTYSLCAAPDISPLEFLNVTVSRTHQNRGLVVQWLPTLPPPPGTVITHYQVEYRSPEGEGGVAQVDSAQSWVFVDELEDAQNYEVGPWVISRLLDPDIISVSGEDQYNNSVTL